MVVSSVIVIIRLLLLDLIRPKVITLSGTYCTTFLKPVFILKSISSQNKNVLRRKRERDRDRERETLIDRETEKREAML